MSPRKKSEAGPGVVGISRFLGDGDIGALTLNDLERIAERFGAAVRTIREAQLLFRAGGELQHPRGDAAAPTELGDPAQGRAGTPTRPAPPPSSLTPEQQASLEQWRKSPARAKLIEEARGRDEPPNGFEG